MTLSNFFLTYGQIIAVAIIPVALWFLGISYQNRKTKRDAKLRLFLTLIANRQFNPPTREYVKALNQIDIVFQDNDKVRRAWRSFLDSLDARSQHFSNNSLFQLDLLSEMAEDLGYKHLRQTDLTRYYFPECFQSEKDLHNKISVELFRVLQNSESFSCPFSSSNEGEEE
jgi:hypothetical protein